MENEELWGRTVKEFAKQKEKQLYVQNFRTHNSDSGSSKHQLHTVLYVLSSTTHSFANSQIRNLLGRLCFLDIILKLNYLLSIIILMPSFKIQNQGMYVYMGTKERSCHGFKWEYH